MRLGEKQELFSELLPILLLRMHQAGYKTRLAHLYRCEDCKVGRNLSCHKLKLAIDINLFFGGEFLRETEHHRPFGEFWESLHPLCRWGGRFQDGNHYSLEHAGRK